MFDVIVNDSNGVRVKTFRCPVAECSIGKARDNFIQLKGWRVAILIATVFAALATPAADIVSMVMLAGILVVLFFAAAGVSMLFDRRRARQAAASEMPSGPIA